MKQLFINNQLVVIDNIMFPFTYKINDLDNINFIGFPVSKTISIPRCNQNDNIFGGLADITRLNFTNMDYGKGISFNQIKKAGYQLLNNSEVVSEGSIKILDITPNSYEIELYDKAIDIIESLEDKDLTQIELINPRTNYPLNELLTYSTVNDFITYNSGIVPVFCDDENKLDSKTLYAKDAVSGTYKLVELPNELTQLQMKSFVPSQMNYATKLNNVLNSLETYEPLLQFNSDFRNLVDDVYMLLNKPTNPLITNSGTSKEQSKLYQPFVFNSGVATINTNYELTNENNGRLYFVNGVYKFICNVKGRIASSVGSSAISKYNNQILTDANTVYDQTLGRLYIKTICEVRRKSNNDIVQEGLPIVNEIILRKDNNAFYNYNNGYPLIDFENNIIIDLKVANTEEADCYIRTQVTISNKHFDKPANNSTITYFFNSGNNYMFDRISFKNVWDYISSDFMESDIFNTASVMPKIKIKDFLINIAKTYRLDVRYLGGKLVFDLKNYSLSNEILKITDVTSIKQYNSEFSKLNIASEEVNNKLIEEYNKKYPNKKWCSQNISTGYSIKNNTRDIVIPYSTSLLFTDYSYFGYDLFGQYTYGGYSKTPVGSIKDLENKLVLGYLKECVDTVNVSNSYFDKEKQEQYYANRALVYNSALQVEGQWSFDDNASSVLHLKKFNTFSPYKFNGSNIEKSFDITKPYYNFAGLNDTTYTKEVTMYDRLYMKTVEDTYNSNTHILTTQLYIDGTLDIYKIYNYKNSNYILKSINEYDPTEDNIYEVELMRVSNINNYITLPQPIDFKSNFQFNTNFFFSGDVRNVFTQTPLIKSQLQLQKNGGNWIVLQNYYPSYNEFTYNSSTNETKLLLSNSYNKFLKIADTNKYRLVTDFNYYKNGVLTSFRPSMSTPITIGNTNSAGTITDPIINRQFKISDSAQTITTPLYIQSFKISDMYASDVYYTITLKLKLVNYDSNNSLVGTTASIYRLNISGIGNTSTTILHDTNSTSTAQTTGAAEYTFTIQVPDNNANPSTPISAVNLEIAAYRGGSVVVNKGVNSVYFNIASNLPYNNNGYYPQIEFDTFTNNGSPAIFVNNKRNEIQYLNSISPSYNLINNSKNILQNANNTGTGTSTLKNDEDVIYTRTIGNIIISTFGQDVAYNSPIFKTPLINGNSYTVSVDIRIPTAGDVGFYNSKGLRFVNVINKWVRISHTFVFNNADNRILGLTYNKNIIDSRKWQIEPGSTANDWSPILGDN